MLGTVREWKGGGDHNKWNVPKITNNEPISALMYMYSNPTEANRHFTQDGFFSKLLKNASAGIR